MYIIPQASRVQRSVRSWIHLSVRTEKLADFIIRTFYFAFRLSNRLLVLISDVIVFCRATFNILSTRKHSWYALIEYDQQKKHRRNSTNSKPGLLYAKRQANFFVIVLYTRVPAVLSISTINRL